MTAHMRIARLMTADRAAELEDIPNSVAGPQHEDTLSRLNRRAGKDRAPQMIHTYQRDHGKDFDFIAVAMSRDPAHDVADYSRTRHSPFQVALDKGGQVARACHDVRMSRTTSLVDKQGRVVKRILGHADCSTLDALIRDELGRPA